MRQLEMPTYITGVGHTQFGRLEGENLESLIVDAGASALEDSGLEARQIDEIYVGHYGAGLSDLAFISSLSLQIDDALRLTPSLRVENACASGSAAVHQGIRAIQAGATHVLVIGAEKMTHRPAEVVGRALMAADYEGAGTEGTSGFASLFASVLDDYSSRFGDVSDSLARIAAKNHANGARNPMAHYQKDLGFEFCRSVHEKNPRVVGQLRRTDCSPVSDGAAALILSRNPRDGLAENSTRIVGFGQANDILPAHRRDSTAFRGVKESAIQALRMANLGVKDMDFAEVHDCFTIAELIVYEALGLAEPGEGRRLIDEGVTLAEGAFPVNVSGGLKSKGHPVGATGVSQHVMASQQLTGRAGPMQLGSPRRGLVQNMGGLAIANYTTILESLS
jgi:acetyl-CoA C-acetyltransferase